MRTLLKHTILFTSLIIALNSCNDLEEDIGYFFIDDMTTYVGQKVYFTHNGPSQFSYHWTFGDGETSKEYVPSHIYNRPGKYTVSLKIFSASGNLKLLKNLEVTVKQASVPDARFTLSDDFVFIDEEVEFTPVANFGSAVETTWSFGDGNSSGETNPVHSYEAAGNYEVSLFVKNEIGETHTFSDTVFVGDYAHVTITVDMEKVEDEILGGYYDVLFLLLYVDEFKYYDDTNRIYDYDWFKNSLFAGENPPMNLFYPVQIEYEKANSSFKVTYELELPPYIPKFYFHLWDGNTKGYFSNKNHRHTISNLDFGKSYNINSEARFYDW